MKSLNLLTFVFTMLLTINGYCQNIEGKLIQKTIPAPSLSNNLFYIPNEQLIAIYLPPSYEKTDINFPVVYYLPGFGDYVYYYTFYGVFQGYSLKTSMDDLISQNKIDEMIIVIVNGQYFCGGSFYVNSPVIGNWEDFVVKDVVSYIDSNYRTIKDAKYRAITGHSMGGFGAINIAMHHSEVYSLVYCLSPGLFDKNGLKKSILFLNEERIKNYLSISKQFEGLPTDQSKAKFINYTANLLMTVNDFYTAFDFAYGMAFAPNPNCTVPFIDYPYSFVNEKLILNDTFYKKYNNGFGGLDEKVRIYKNNLNKLKSIVIDVGNHDSYEWIIDGSKYFNQLLNDNGIKCELFVFNGDHQDMLKERIEEHMLPHLSTMFKK